MNIVAAGIAVVWVLWFIFCVYLDYVNDSDGMYWLIGGVALPLILSVAALVIYMVVDGLMEAL